MFIGGGKRNDGREKCWGCNPDEQVDTSNRPSRDCFMLQLLQHVQSYVQMPRRDVMRVFGSAGIDRRFFPSAYVSPGSH